MSQCIVSRLVLHTGCARCLSVPAGTHRPEMKFLNLASGGLDTADIAMTCFAKQG